MKRNDETIRRMAREEKARAVVPDHVRSAVEETLASLPETPETKVLEMPKRRHWKLPATIAAAFLALFLILPNTGAPVAHALSEIPVLGTVFQAVTFREYAEQTDTTDVSVKTPKVASDGKGKEAADAVSEEIDKMNEAAVAKFKQDHADGGYGSLDIYYDVAADTDRWYTVRVVREETAASGAVETDYYTFDKTTGDLVILSDLFEKDEYIAHISENIKEQMRAQMKKDDSVSYFLDSDMPDEDFSEIDPNQDFYIAEDGSLVVCFDEYEVAPGSMGTVSFRIPQSVYRSDLKPEYR
ncbi:MAG: DUF3298 domain-containing protein [Clostridia bacterium]|nr:DUF3298 domain-containing protein [Clostridia bacterium]